MLQGYLAALSSATQSEVSPAMLTDLPERDLLLDQFRAGYKQAKDLGTLTFSKTYSAEKRDDVLSAASCLADQLNENIFLLTKQSEFCGAVNLPGANLLRHCAAIITLDGDAVMILSQDHSQGLLLDFAADDPQSCYELTVWGDRWSLAMLNCTAAP